MIRVMDSDFLGFEAPSLLDWYFSSSGKGKTLRIDCRWLSLTIMKHSQRCMKFSASEFLFREFRGTDCNLHTVQRFIGLDCAMKKLEQSQQDRNSRERDGAAPNLC